jgi:hypothetical protein
VEPCAEEGVHVPAPPGVDNDDPLVITSLRRDDHGAIALADVEEHDLERSPLHGVVCRDEELAHAVGIAPRPDHLEPAVLRPTLDVEEVAPQHLADLRLSVRFVQESLLAPRAHLGQPDVPNRSHGSSRWDGAAGFPEGNLQGCVSREGLHGSDGEWSAV